MMEKPTIYEKKPYKIKDKKNFLIGFLLMVIILSILTYAYNGVSNENYKQGFDDATLVINQQILNSLNQNGFITVYVPYNNQSVPVRLAPIQTENEK